jgi:pyrroloquinoline-quinone synthase
LLNLGYYCQNTFNQEQTMDIKDRLANVINKWNLLTHPFYQAWSAGTLPVEALQIYAREYGTFIECLPQAWETLGDAETAQEEREHVELWADFARGLGSVQAAPALQESAALAKTAAALFADRASALGGLYAFEVQQPETAQSKLLGLKAWYSLPASAETYFAAHAVNWHESAKILDSIRSLRPDEQEQAIEACDQMGEALWNALSGIHEKTCMQ